MNLINTNLINKNLLHIFFIGPLFILFSYILKNEWYNEWYLLYPLFKFSLILFIIIILFSFNNSQSSNTYIKIFHYILCCIFIYLLYNNNIHIIHYEYILSIGIIIIIYHIYLYYNNTFKGGNQDDFTESEDSEDFVESEDSVKLKDSVENVELSNKLCKIKEILTHNNKEYDYWIYHSGTIYDINTPYKTSNNITHSITERQFNTITSYIKMKNEKNITKINFNSMQGYNETLLKNYLDHHLKKRGSICPNGLFI